MTLLVRETSPVGVLASADSLTIRPNWAGAKAKREEAIKEQWVGVMEARLVRDKLAECWRSEGVNHYEVCHPLTEKYLELLRTNRVRTVYGCTAQGCR